MSLFDACEVIYIYCIVILMYLKTNLGRLSTVKNLIYQLLLLKII